MTRRSSVLAAVLPAVVAAVGATSMARADDLVGRLPGAARVLGSIDLAALRASPALGRFDRDAKLSAAGAAEVAPGLGAVGSDLTRSVERIAFGAYGDPESDDGLDFAVLVRGGFDADGLLEKARADGATRVEVAGAPALDLGAGDEGVRTYLSEVADGIVAFASRGGLEALRLEPAGGPSPAVAQLRAEVPEDADAWVVLASGAPADGAASDAFAMAGAVRELGLWLRASEDLDVQARARTTDAASASQLAMMLQLTGAMALAQQVQGTPLASAASALAVSAEGSRVTAGVTLSAEQLEALGRMAETAIGDAEDLTAAKPADPAGSAE